MTLFVGPLSHLFENFTDLFSCSFILFQRDSRESSPGFSLTSQKYPGHFPVSAMPLAVYDSIPHIATTFNKNPWKRRTNRGLKQTQIF